MTGLGITAGYQAQAGGAHITVTLSGLGNVFAARFGLRVNKMPDCSNCNILEGRL